MSSNLLPDETQDPWFIFNIPVLRRAADGMYEVTFNNKSMMQSRPGDGEIPRVPRSAFVEVFADTEGQCRVVSFHPGEHEVSRLSRPDYERKAIELVAKEIEAKRA